MKSEDLQNASIGPMQSHIITAADGLEQQSMFDGSPQYIYDQSIRLLREFDEASKQRHPLGYVVGYSGGKDSDVMIELFKAAGVKFHIIHNHTTIDAPETVYYIRKKFAELTGGGVFRAKPTTLAKVFGKCAITNYNCPPALPAFVARN